MKRAAFLAALALTMAGCVELPKWAENKPPVKGMPAAVEPLPVKPEQVNDASAPRVMQALRDELERAASTPPAVTPNP